MFSFIPRRAALLAAAFVALGGAAQAAYPERPLRLVVPFAPGGSVDVTARLVAQAMRSELGQDIVVENRTGGGGTIGTAAVAMSPADGYTLLWANSAVLAVAPVLVPNLTYDPQKDLRPVSLVLRTWHVVLGSPQFPARNLAELLAAARKHPGELNFGSAGAGSAVHLVAARVLADAGVDMVHIPYRGSTPALTDLASGRVQMVVETLASGMQQALAGRAVALAVSAPQRVPVAPDVPTVAESGLPGFQTSAWFGIAAPAGTPDAVVSRLEAAAKAAVAQEHVRTRLTELGVDTVASSPEDFAEVIRAEAASTRDLVKRANITAE